MIPDINDVIAQIRAVQPSVEAMGRDPDYRDPSSAGGKAYAEVQAAMSLCLTKCLGIEASGYSYRANNRDEEEERKEREAAAKA